MACITAEIRDQVQERIDKEITNASPAADEPKITSKLIQDCLFANEMGDGILYATLFRNKFLYCKNTQEWYEWSGHSWRIDRMGRAVAGVEKVAEVYLTEYRALAAAISESAAGGDDGVSKLQRLQRDLLKRVSQLRGSKRRRACIEFAHTIENPLAIEGEQFDDKPMLFPCANGVIDLETGKLRAGCPGDYLTKSSPIAFAGIDEPAALWEKSLREIFNGNEELAAYLRRLFGYSITGLVSEKVFPVLYGKTGWNGRSLIITTISHIMGHMAGSIPAEMLLSPKFTKSSSSPTSDIMSLKGTRCAFASETDEHQRFSAAKIKWLTGTDQLVGRTPYDKYDTRFFPTHKLFLSTNNQPQAPPNDKAFWERLHLIPFNVSFVKREIRETYERRAILNLDRQLRKEGPGILAWLVRGCLEWQRDGLQPPREVTDATEAYRRNEDLMADYIDQCLVLDPGAKEQAAPLYARFVDWWHSNISKSEPSGTWFGRALSQKFEKTKVDGRVVYHGIRLSSVQVDG
jgi:putative DNA primase/helicase